jgi:hypothetical protein
MKLLVHLVIAVRALLVASLASGVAASQERGLADQEEADWDQIRREGTAEAFQRYLEHYPIGRHASEAFGCTISGALCGSDTGAQQRSVSPIEMY